MLKSSNKVPLRLDLKTKVRQPFRGKENLVQPTKSRENRSATRTYRLQSIPENTILNTNKIDTLRKLNPINYGSVQSDTMNRGDNSGRTPLTSDSICCACLIAFFTGQEVLYTR